MGNINSLTISVSRSGHRNEPRSRAEIDEARIAMANDIQLRRTSFWSFWKHVTDKSFRERVKAEHDIFANRFLPTFKSFLIDYRKAFTWAEVGLWSYTTQEIDNHRRNAMIKGTLFGLITLPLCRFGLPYIFQRLVAGPFRVNKAWLASPLGRVTPFWYWADFTFDVLVGGVYPGFYAYKVFNNCINTPVDMSAISKFPLLPGRSDMCHQMCPKIVATAKHVSGEPAAAEFWKNPQTIYLQEMRNLVLNCQRRAMWEDEQRKKHDLSASEPVDVPLYGLPDNKKDLPEDFWYQPLLDRAEAEEALLSQDERE